MSTKKTPEEIAEERYPNDAENPLYGLPSPYCSGQRQGYAACYREHVLNRQSEEKPVAWMNELGYTCRTVDRESGLWEWDGYDTPLYAHPSTPPVTVDGIMELWHKSHNEEAKEFNSFPHNRFRSRLESYLTDNSREWVYEDQLPDMTSEEYDAWYLKSKVIDGVRMGPAVTPNTKS